MRAGNASSYGWMWLAAIENERSHKRTRYQSIDNCSFLLIEEMVVSVKELEGAIEIDNTESLETNMSNRNLPVSKRNEIEKHLPVAT